MAELAAEPSVSSPGSSQNGSSRTVASNLHVPSTVAKPNISASVKEEPGSSVQQAASNTELDLKLQGSTRGASFEAKQPEDLLSPHSHETQQSSTQSLFSADCDHTLIAAAEDHLSQEKRHRGYVLAYQSLFRIFYNQVPLVSSTDIDQALEQCEKLVAIAQHYGSLHIIRPYLGNSLAQFRHTLFKGIAKDPPRWMVLAVSLESATIYSEALVHCAGCWPCWPWPTPSTSVQAAAFSIITTKGKELLALRSEIDQELLINSLEDDDGRPVTLKKSAEQWMVVNIWRDWLARNLNIYRNNGNGYFGTYYRTLSKGGDAYLPAEKQAEKLCEISGYGMRHWEDVAQDLKALKDFAMRAVALLVKNNLFLEPVSAGIEYLTCTEVTADDYPWLKATNPLEAQDDLTV